MKSFGLILGFIAAAIAAPTIGYKKDQPFILPEDALDMIAKSWPKGEKKDCIFWTGFDKSLLNEDLDKFTKRLDQPFVSWFDFFTLADARKWRNGLGERNDGYVFGITSAAYAERCGEDGKNIWVLIPSDRDTDDPYPQGTPKAREANWAKWEQPWVTKPNTATKIHRVDPEHMDDDMKDDSKIIWKKGDEKKGRRFTRFRIAHNGSSERFFLFTFRVLSSTLNTVFTTFPNYLKSCRYRSPPLSRMMLLQLSLATSNAVITASSCYNYTFRLLCLLVLRLLASYPLMGL